MDKPIDTRLQACASCAICEGVDPVSVDLGHQKNTQGPSVSYALQESTATGCWPGTDQREPSGATLARRLGVRVRERLGLTRVH
jgi:hypothetical protein